MGTQTALTMEKLEMEEEEVEGLMQAIRELRLVFTVLFQQKARKMETRTKLISLAERRQALLLHLVDSEEEWRERI